MQLCVFGPVIITMYYAEPSLYLQQRRFKLLDSRVFPLSFSHWRPSMKEPAMPSGGKIHAEPGTLNTTL